MIIAALAAPAFDVTTRESIPLPIPLVGETVSHEALLDAVQEMFEVTVAVVIPAVAGAAQDVSESSSDPGATAEPAWVTVMVLLLPPPETVIIPVLATPVFAVTSRVSMVVPVPLVGVTVSHEALLDAVQDASVRTIAVLISTVASADHDVSDTSSPDGAVFAKLLK